MKQKPIPCSICGRPIEAVGDWTEGNNAQPVNDGRCCGDCDATVVIPARLKEFYGRPTR